MKIPSNPHDLYTRFIETKAEKSRLEQEEKDLRLAIMQHMGDNKALVECGFAVKLTSGVRKTANASLIETHMGIKLNDKCFKITSYDSLSVTKIKA